MTEKQERIFMERKARYMKELMDELAIMSKQKIPRSATWIKIRDSIRMLEQLHTPIGKKFPIAERKLWKYCDVRAFCLENDYTYLHVRRCRDGLRTYSPRLQEVIINHVDKIIST